jgi:NTE family protein
MQRSGTTRASHVLGRRPRVGLVLGGGGILGGAWLIGALHALQQASNFDPVDASHIVGTSAGSVVGSLVAEGIPPWFLVFHQRGGDVSQMTDRFHEPIRDADEESRSFITWTGTVPRPVLGSPCLALRTALQPWRYPPMTAASAWIGRGFLSTDEIGRVVRSVVPSGWSSHPNLWLVALDYQSGKRVAFGREDAPTTDLHRAVRASCSIPGLYRPTRIGGRLYIDGGVWSPSNLDLLSHDEAEFDLVIALNPMSSMQPGLPTTIVERVERRVRSASGRRFGREARRLRARGTQLLLIQPEADDLKAMGINLMDPARRVDVLETAIETTTRRLRQPDALDAIGVLQGLPPSANGHRFQVHGSDSAAL